MKKRTFGLLILLMCVTAALLFSCTENERAKFYGGTITVNLPSGQKLVNATWKDSELWYLTRPAKQGEVSETYNFQEKSNFGIQEGCVVFNESI